MPRVLGILLFLLAAPLALVPAPVAEADTMPLAEFDARLLSADDKRLLQGALAAFGHYDGAFDGIWGRGSQAAFETWAAMEFDEPPLNAHAALLAIDFLDSAERDGWTLVSLPGLGTTLALPLRRLEPPEAEEGGERRWSRTGSLTVLIHRYPEARTRSWHDAAVRANGVAGALRTIRTADRLVTRGTLADGRRFYSRSDRRGADDWATVHLAAADDEADLFTLIVAGIDDPVRSDWTLPKQGVLADLIAETADLFAVGPDASPGPFRAHPVPHAAALPRHGQDSATGTGFYLADRTVVTAAHVVSDCLSVTLADGSPLQVIAADPDLDVAALAATVPASRWLTLASSDRPRLGERVHAAGFPYYSIAGTAMHLTTGNVSALAGVDDDSRFFSFTAPVQPGNSGGPLIDASGGVLGLVVARLSEDFIVEATGSLPQNVNYALRETELAGFLARAGLAPTRAGLAGYDTDDGVPDGFESAVVPIICE